MTMRIATWNVNSLAVRLPQVLDWLGAHRPDALCLQETKLTDDKFPQAALAEAGYVAQWFGQKTYNGVALITPVGAPAAEGVVKNIPGFFDEQARVIAATLGDTRVIGAYFPNGQSVDSDKFQYKLAWLEALQTWMADELQAHRRLVLVGDFNIAPEDCDVHDPVAWADQLFEQAPRSWSWWDYRNLAFRKNQGLRIDHILVSDALKPAVSACTIDKLPRKHERPSDHAPVMVTLES
jgi:exodeoxyribonuclease-3